MRLHDWETQLGSGYVLQRSTSGLYSAAAGAQGRSRTVVVVKD
jgi:hypothetical protein